MTPTNRLVTLSLSAAAALTLSAACSGPGGGGGGGTYVPQQDGIVFGDNGFPNGDTQGDANVPPVDGASDGTTPTGDATTAQISCGIDQDCPGALPFCGSDFFCVQCKTVNDCNAGTCVAGSCVVDDCTAGDKKCSGNTALVCKANGTGWNTLPCGDGVCLDGACTVCEPGKIRCEGLKVMQCSADGGSWTQTSECAAGKKCLEGQCLDCYPGATQCNGTVVERCSDLGVFQPDKDCAADGQGCLLGKCFDACTLDIKSSNAGCDYWAVDLDNIPSVIASPNYQYSVVVANFTNAPADVTVYRKDGPTAQETQVIQRTVAASGLETLDLPTNIMGNAGIYYATYRVQSTAPIVAAQFNPLENIDVYSNDASLLLPSNTFGTQYIALVREEIQGQDANGNSAAWRGYVTVVAKEDDTTVQVTPTVACQAGAGVAAMQAGQTYSFTLARYQVLNIKSDQDGGDISGTLVTSDKPVGAYAGHDAAVTSNQCCADHLEQQLFPVSTWGKTYVAGKSMKRGIEKDYWKVVASEDGTVVSFAPAVNSSVQLNRGEVFEFPTDKDFVIAATKPIMVSQTLASSMEIGGPQICGSDADCAPGFTCDTLFGQGCTAPTCSFDGDTSCPSGTTCKCQDLGCGCEPIGDPALIYVPPVEQFRDEYIFLTPNKYRDDYVNITAPNDASVKLDGLTIPPGNFTPIASTQWKVGRVKVNDGVHTLTASAPVGLAAYGYDDDVSYGYTAGLNLKSTAE